MIFNKIKRALKSTKGKITCAVASFAASVGTAFPALAAEETVKDYVSQYWDLIKGDFSPSTVLSIIGIVIGSVVLLFLFWFGIRYITRKISVALKKGKISA